MLPKTHILLGALFAVLMWALAPETPWYSLVLVFLASFLIDFDHYVAALPHTQSLSIKKAYEYYILMGKREKLQGKNDSREKGVFHVFHTLEFHIIIAAAGMLWTPFFYVFIGMVFHSLMDLLWLTYDDSLHIREFFFFNWLKRNLVE